VTAALALSTARPFGGEQGWVLRLELLGMLCLGAIVSIGIVLWAVRRLV